MMQFTEEQKKALAERLNHLAEKLKWHNAAYAQDVLQAADALSSPPVTELRLPDMQQIYSLYCTPTTGSMNALARIEVELLRLNATAPAVPAGWTNNLDADAALVMLDRIDTLDQDDDARIEDVKRIIRKLAAEGKE